MEVLVPFDFSQESIHAVQFGEQITKETGCKLKVVHCLDIPNYPYFETDNAKSLRKLLYQDANSAITNKLKSILDSHADTEVCEGSASSIILKKNASNDVRFTIMGYKEQHLPDKIGSTTKDILRFTKGSVFSIKHAVNLQSIKNILLVTDFQSTPVSFITNLKLLQKLNNGNLNLLYVNNQNNWLTTKETYDKMEEFCKIHDLKNSSLDIINDNTLESGVLSKISRSKVDLIALKISRANEKMNAKEIHLSAEKIIDNTDIPVLTYTYRSMYS